MSAGFPSFIACSLRTSFSLAISSSGTSSLNTYLGFIAAACIATSLATSSLAPFTTATTAIFPPICRYAPKFSSFFFSITATRRKSNFSPILAVLSTTKSLIVPSPNGRALASSKVLASLFNTVSPTFLINSLNSSFLLTKSVSALISMITALLSLMNTSAKPSAAILASFFPALAIPFSRNQSIAASRLPSVSLRAFLQSIIPAPVCSRNSFTKLALIMCNPSF